MFCSESVSGKWPEQFFDGFLLLLANRQIRANQVICVVGISYQKEAPIWVFPKIGVPQNGWFILEHPIKMDDLGGKPTIFGNTHFEGS